MLITYTHLSYEDYKQLEEQIKDLTETTHRTEGGFYHKSIRLKLGDGVYHEYHGPLVGGDEHLREPNEFLKKALEDLREEINRPTIDDPDKLDRIVDRVSRLLG